MRRRYEVRWSRAIEILALLVSLAAFVAWLGML